MCNNKKKYAKPKIDVYGDIENITLGGGTGYDDGADEGAIS